MLITCPECSKDVSDSAELCPHCGYRIVGRENLRLCRHCNTKVIPTQNPHDTISLFCPLCNKPITGLAARKLLIGLGLIILAVIVATLLIGFRML